MKLGTILPTRESIALENRFYAEHVQAMRSAEKRLPGTLRIVGGEHRYYTDDDHYSILSFHNRRTLTFERRKDGEWYACR